MTRGDSSNGAERAKAMQTGMTKEEQRECERHALHGLATHLRSLGSEVLELGHPEDDTSSPLNTDSELRINGESWVAEHTRIVYDHRAPSAEEAAERYLRPRLQEIADRYGLSVWLACYAPRWNGKARPTATWDGFVALAERAASTGTWVGDERGNSVMVGGGSTFVAFNFFSAENTALGDQYSRALGNSLPSKLNGQLRVAKELGYRVLLLLDKMPPPKGDPGTMWTPDEGTLRLVVERLLDEVPGVVDEVWLRGAYGDYQHLLCQRATATS